MAMTIRPGQTGTETTYTAGRFSKDDAFIVNQIDGASPFGGTLCSLESDYFVEIMPDGSGRSWFSGRPITSPNGNGKAWYIRDQENGEVWSAFHGPVCSKGDEYEVAFSPGSTTAYALHNKIWSSLTVSISPDSSCELWHVKLQNRSATDRSLTFTTFIRPRAGSALECKFISKDKALIMRRPLDVLDSDRTGRLAQDLVFFHSSTLMPARYQTEKASFIGDDRTLQNPQHLEETRQHELLDIAESPVACMTLEIELPIEGEAEFGFCFGAAHSVEEALETLRKYSSTEAISNDINASRARWKKLSSTIKIESQDRSFDALVNTWLPYEASAEWVKEHAGTPHLDPYRAADSLRCLAPLIATAPDLCRENLLNFAARLSVLGAYCYGEESQITIPPNELLWLAICVAQYVAETGDTSILAHSVPLKDGPALNIREHCERAIRMCIYEKQAEGEEKDLRLLEQALRLWSLVSEDSEEFAAHREIVRSRRMTKKSEQKEKHIIPKRVRYLQSVSSSIADDSVVASVSEYFPSDKQSAKNAGAASLMYAAIVENILGVEATNEGLLINPHLPEAWHECEVTRVFKGDSYKIHIKRSSTKSSKKKSMIVDGEPVLGDMLPFFGDGKEHSIEVVVT